MRVLLVEDSKLIGDTIIEMLVTCQNLEITNVATTCHQATSLLDQQPFDLMILDIALKEGNGFEVMRHVRQPDYPFRIPVTVMLTNHAHPHYRRMAAELGINYFFDKSIDFDQAINAIEFEALQFTQQQPPPSTPTGNQNTGAKA